LHQQNESLQQEAIRLKDERDEMKQTIQSKDGALRVLTDLIQDVQQGGLEHASQGQGSWASQDERKIMGEFQSLNGAIRSWADRFSKKSPLSDDQIRQLGDLSSRVTNVFTSGRAFGEGQFTRDQLPTMLLSAILSQDVYTRVFANPWFFMDFNTLQPAQQPGNGEASTKTKSGSQISEVLNGVFPCFRMSEYIQAREGLDGANLKSGRDGSPQMAGTGLQNPLPEEIAVCGPRCPQPGARVDQDRQ
jgi:hypothetical protein